MRISTNNERRDRIISFVLVAIFLGIINSVADVSQFRYDSGRYWELSNPAPLSAFPEAIRGYLWPYLLMPIHAVDDWIRGSSHIGYRAISSIVYSLVLTSPVADFCRRCFGGHLSVIRRSFIAIATIVVFPGLFVNPLADLPAVILLTCGILLADSGQSTRWPLACICSGALVAASYNVRTIYMISFIVVLVLLPLFFYRGRSIRVRSVAVICFVLGAAGVLIPQALINKRIHGVISPMVLTGAKSTSLMMDQLYWGVTIQRYETSILGTDPAPGVFYADPSGIAFNAMHSSYRSPPTIMNYVKAVYSDPLFFLGLYGRHFVNGVDVRDGMVYTTRHSDRRIWWSLFCLTLFTFCTFVLCTRTNRRYGEWGYLSPIILAVACIIPGAVETRFLMPLYLLLFGGVATSFELEHFRGQLTAYRSPMIVGFILISSLWFGITSSTMAAMQFTSP